MQKNLIKATVIRMGHNVAHCIKADNLDGLEKRTKCNAEISLQPVEWEKVEADNWPKKSDENLLETKW